MTASNDPVAATRHWLNDFVVGLNLCPFAGAVLKDDSLHIEVCDEIGSEAILKAVLQQLDLLQQTEESSVATSLLVLSEGLKEFQQFWSLIEVAEQLLQEAELDGIIQIASFHPQYVFEGEALDDVSHYTNRSPYPTLHFIREAQLSRALENYSNPQDIPENNMRTLRQLGICAIKEKLNS